MKLLTFVIVAATALISHAQVDISANPKVGNMVKLDMEATTADGKKAVAVLTVELKQHDAAGKKWLQASTLEIAGKPGDVKESWIPEENLLNDADIQAILTDCVKDGGKLEKVVVPAGTFDACASSFDEADANGTVWFAKSVWGIIKQDITDKASKVRTTMALKAQRAGQ